MAQSPAYTRSKAAESDDGGGCCPLFRKRKKIPSSSGLTDKLSGKVSGFSEPAANEKASNVSADMTLISEPMNHDGEKRPVAITDINEKTLDLNSNGVRSKETNTSEKIREAEKLLNAAGAKLAEAMLNHSGEQLEFESWELRDVADINVVAHDLGSTLANMIKESKEIETSQEPAIVFIEKWFIKSLPLMNKGLTFAKVFLTTLITKWIKDVVPPPWGYVISGVIFLVKVTAFSSSLMFRFHKICTR